MAILNSFLFALQVDDVLQRCREYLIKKINAENCVRLLSFADLFSCEELKQSAKRMVEHKFTAVYHQEAFMQLSHDLLIDILSSDNLNVERRRQFVKLLCYGWSTTRNHGHSICPQFLAKSESMHFQK